MLSQHRCLILAEQEGDAVTLTAAASAEDPTVRALALGSLARIDALDDGTLTTALADPNRDVRCRAIELAVGRPRIALVAQLDDEDDLVVETAAWALGERSVAVPETVAALAGVAVDHSVSICREAAVAALGAIGSPAGLDAILAGMSDRAPVRRRAVLALAPFDGQRVRDALEAALSDRDRQVRQAAEDLL